MEIETCSCGGASFLETGFGLNVCLTCGLGKRGSFNAEGSFWSQGARLLNTQSYTRRKRFKKYLFRAMRRQSSSTIPRETWEYLLEHGPYHSSEHVQRTLKAARHLKRKCYDCLPFLTAALCPHINVPMLSEMERVRALELFDKIDSAIKIGPFVSYLFCLEYILKRMGRGDIVKHINRIQCSKRRALYKCRLDAIFSRFNPPTGILASLSRGRSHSGSKSAVGP